MSKRVIIIHGWGKNPLSDWHPWLIKQLKEKELEVVAPAMPDTDTPKIEEWVSFLGEIVGEVNEDTYLVGHSVGCQTILRYLESLPEDKKVGGVLLVAPWMHLTGLEGEEEARIAKPWVETQIDWSKIKIHTDKFTAIFSDNDPFVPLTDSKFFEETLNAKIIVEHEKGHFDDESHVKELPVALNELLKLTA